MLTFVSVLFDMIEMMLNSVVFYFLWKMLCECIDLCIFIFQQLALTPVLRQLKGEYVHLVSQSHVVI